MRFFYLQMTKLPNERLFKPRVRDSNETKRVTSMISNFSVIPIHWLLTVDSEMAFLFLLRLLRICLLPLRDRSFKFCGGGMGDF